MSDSKLQVEKLIEILDKYAHVEIHIHHTYRPNHKNFTGSNHQDLQDGMRNYHKNTLKWSDIAQHVTLFPDGLFLTGRGFSKTPASIKGKNGSKNAVPFMVEMVGNFDKGNDRLEGKQKEAILKLAKYFQDKGRSIVFHNEHSYKSCPGSSIDKEVFLKEVSEVGKPEYLYKVQCGAFGHEENAQKLAEKLKKSGFDVYIVKEKREK